MNIKGEKMIYYYCEICGNFVESDCDCVEFKCCDQPMKEVKENIDDSASKEKHVPVITVNGNKVCVSVGSVLHPSEEKHYIMWIRLRTDKGEYFRKLKSTDKPEACFMIADDEKVLEARAYCNIHGLWKSSN